MKNALAPPWGGARAFLYCAGRYTDRDNCFAGPLKRDLQKEEMRYAEKNSRFSHPPQKGRPFYLVRMLSAEGAAVLCTAAPLKNF